MNNINSTVMIVGGGPCGLMLANELGRRGVSVFLVDEKQSTGFNPQANATQARTMEHYRRLGFADEIRALGLPEDYPTDIAYYTRFSGHELARFQLPSSREAKARVGSMKGAWSAAELPHRVSQKYVEKVLRSHAEALPNVDVRYGYRALDFQETENGVVTTVECIADGVRSAVHSSYLVGADGPRSSIREKLGIRYGGETGVVRNFMGGRMYAIYVRCPSFYESIPHSPAWMNVTFNNDRRAFMAAVDGKGEFAFHTQLRPDEKEEDITDEKAKAMFHAAVGAELPIKILSRGGWTAGHSLVAEHFQKGRVFLGGDAVHLFTPAGGLGYNTAVEDAVNLGWKLAAVIQGRASESLLDTYELERRPLALRNTSYARGFADSLGLYKPIAEIEDDSPIGKKARAEAGKYFETHGRTEFNIPGVTFGGRYNESPAIVSDGSVPPADTANAYEPTACPGGRPPHVWLSNEESLFDQFGFEWTLLTFENGRNLSDAFEAAMKRTGNELRIVHVEHEDAKTLYGAALVLIRPDQIVAWRGDSATCAEAVVAQLLGYTQHPVPAVPHELH